MPAPISVWDQGAQALGFGAMMHFLLFCLALAPVAAPPAYPPPLAPDAPIVRAKLLTAGLIRSEDYPLDAIRRGEQGLAIVRLSVTTTGTVDACAVVRSSGSATLDLATCRLIRERAQYAPARNRKGRAVLDHHMLPVRWVLPTNAAAPPPGSVRQ